MGEVYRAHDNVNKRDVAIKILPAQLSHNEEVKKRFLREMVTCSKLSHGHVIEVYDYGQMKDTLYYVMEIIEGKSVAQMIDADGAQPVDLALLITKHILEALSYIHENNLIHRDLKPSNILVEQKAAKGTRAVLMDFGLVKAFDSQLTRTGRVLGTPRYIAPEMLSQGQVDCRSDVFQMGVILYEMVTGDYAFKGTTRAEVARNCLTKEPEAASMLNPNVDVNLDNIIFNAMEKDPEQRYATAEEMLKDILAYQKGSKIYRRHVRSRRTRDISQPVPVIETVEANDPSLLDYLEDGGDDATPPWYLFALIPILLLPFILYGVYGGERVYTVRDVRIEEEVDRAHISWRSEEPYPTVVQFGTSKRSMSIVEKTSKETKTHSVSLEALKEDTDYLFQVVFPEGKRSPDYKFRTKRFKLTDVRWEYNRFGKLDVSWKTNVPSTGRLRYGQGADMRTIREKEPTVIHRHYLTIGDPTKDLTFLIVSATSDGKERVSEKRRVPSPFTLGRELNKALGAFKAQSFVSRLMSSDPYLTKKRSAVYDLAVEQLEAQPFHKDLKAFTHVSSIFFDDKRVPLSWKTQLYHKLVTLVSVDGALAAIGSDRVTRVPQLIRGDFAFGEDTTLKELNIQTVPVSIPEMGGLKYSPSQRNTIEFRAMGLREEVEYPLLLLNAGQFGKAEVRLSLRGFNNLLRLDFTVNGRATLSFYNLRPSFAEDRLDLAHRFPASLLREGTNVFKLAVGTVNGKANQAVVQIKGVTLAFVPK